MYSSLLPHQKKGTTLKLSDVLPFNWDNGTTDKPVKTEAEQKAELEETKAFWAKQDALRKAKELK